MCVCAANQLGEERPVQNYRNYRKRISLARTTVLGAPFPGYRQTALVTNTFDSEAPKTQSETIKQSDRQKASSVDVARFKPIGLLKISGAAANEK